MPSCRRGRFGFRFGARAVSRSSGARDAHAWRPGTCMRALSRKLATPLRRHVLCPCRGLDCPRCFAQCEALRRTASVLNTPFVIVFVRLCARAAHRYARVRAHGEPAPAAARRRQAATAGDSGDPRKPEPDVLHAVDACAASDAGDPPVHRMLAHTEGMRCIFETDVIFSDTTATAHGLAREIREAAHTHLAHTRISVRDSLTTQPRPPLRRPTCGNPQRSMCCHRTRRPPCHA